MPDQAHLFAKGGSFLIVEDDTIIVIMLEFMLNEAGAQSISVANSAAQALSLIESNTFDVAIFDRQVRDGVSYSAAIQARKQGSTIIIASGMDELDLPDELSDAILLPKPFELTHFEQAVLEAVGRRCGAHSVS